MIVNFQGAKSIVRKTNFSILLTVFLATAVFISTSCNGSGASNSTVGGPVDTNETAATVNGKVIKLEEIERVIKQQGQGQESKLSPLELAQARLQVLESLIQQEVMFQKAEKEATVPSDEEITAEFNKQKTGSGLSADQIEKQMKESGMTEASARENIKKTLATRKLVEKITGKVEPPKDAEIDAFYNGNKQAFVKKKGVKLAAIVIDPADNGEGDTTKTEADAVQRGNEVIKQLQQGGDFAAIARERSEDQTRLQGGDLGYISEEEMKKNFPPQVVGTLMNPNFKNGQIVPAQMQGKFYILKLQERSDKDESLTLETPGVRQDITNSLINARKELVAASYQAMAMNEAKIENFLAKKVIENPNQLSGARPASPDAPNTNANVDTNTNANTNVNANVLSNSAGNTNSNVNTKAVNKSNANANAK